MPTFPILIDPAPGRRFAGPGRDSTVICAIGDVHGHLQLAPVMAARWQMELAEQFAAVLLAGDVGVYRDPGGR